MYDSILTPQMLILHELSPKKWSFQPKNGGFFSGTDSINETSDGQEVLLGARSIVGGLPPDFVAAQIRRFAREIVGDLRSDDSRIGGIGVPAQA